MSSTAEQTAVPTGTWKADPVHSTVSFEVPYAANTFTATVPDFEATLQDGTLTGVGRVESLKMKDENMQVHLQSPEFFDLERHAEVRFESSSISRDGDNVEAEGRLTVKGITKPVTLKGSITGPLVDHFGANRVGLKLETVVDRTQFDMNWNMPLPSGEGALSNDVTLKADLTLVGQ